MKHIYCLAALASVVILAGCGQKEGEVTKPSQGPAAVGPAPIKPAMAAAAEKPDAAVSAAPVRVVQPVKPGDSAAPAATASTPPPAPKKWNLFSSDPKPAPATPAAPAAPTATVKPAEPKQVAPTPPTARTSAKVVMVKSEPEYRFVVIEFTTTDIPSAGSQLTVYRGKERVGAVKVTDPVRPPHVTADIVDGKLRVGDEIR